MVKSHLAWLLCLAGCVVCAACQAYSAVAPAPSIAPSLAPPTQAALRLLDLSRVTLPAPTAPPPTASPLAAPLTAPLTAPPIPPTPTPELPTATPLQPVLVAVPATPPATARPAAGPPAPTPACQNQAEFVRHLSISPHTALDPLQHFGKVWRIKNTGSCTWTPAYSLVFLGGETLAKDRPADPPSIPFPGEVSPGATLDLAVRLVAPQQPGEYTGYWVIQAPDGEKFGLGLQGIDPLVVQIVVRDPNRAARDPNGSGASLPCG